MLKKYVQYFDGQNSGWMALGGHVVELKPDEVSRAKVASFEFDFVNSALADQRPTRSVSVLKPGAIQIVDLEGNIMILEIDEATGLPVKEIVTIVRKDSVSSPTEETFSDWRTVSGVKLPFAVREAKGGEKLNDTLVLDWKINTGLDCNALGKRP